MVRGRSGRQRRGAVVVVQIVNGLAHASSSRGVAMTRHSIHYGGLNVLIIQRPLPIVIGQRGCRRVDSAGRRGDTGGLRDSGCGRQAQRLRSGDRVVIISGKIESTGNEILNGVPGSGSCVLFGRSRGTIGHLLQALAGVAGQLAMMNHAPSPGSGPRP